MLKIQSAEFARLKIEANAFDKAIVRSLRKRIRDLGRDGVEAVKRSLTEAPIDDRPGTADSRQAAADATRVVVSFSARGGGAKITTTNARLDPAHKGFVAAYESANLRHPVFGQDVFVNQPTRPYFGASISEALGRDVDKEMKAAIDDAVRALGGRTT